MTILHVVSAGDIGGAERMLVDLATRPEASGTEHTVALFTPSPALRTFFQTSGVRLFDAGHAAEHAPAFLRRTLGTASVKWIVDRAREADAKAVHVHTFASQAMGTRAARALQLPLVRTEHSTRVYDDPTCWPFARWSLARADAVVAISRHIADVVRARAPFVPADHLSIVPCGVDSSRFSPAPFPALTSEEGDDVPLRLVAIGRFDPRKGFDLAIRAIARISRVARVELEIVGDGDEHAVLERMLELEKIGHRVRMSGWTDDPRGAIARAHAVLCSSRSEGLGLAVLEAMAMARPAIAFPVGGVPEFVRDGDTGFLAAESTVDALVTAIHRALDRRSELASIGQNAARLVADSYTADAMARGYGDVYARVIRTN